MTTTPTTTPGITTSGITEPPASMARHLVATAIVIDPHPADGPQVRLVWSDTHQAWIFPTAHVTGAESLPETALRAATAAGIHDAYLLRATPLERVPGLCPVDSPWRTYTLPAPTRPAPTPGQPPPPPWHQHIDHLFIALADSTTPPQPSTHTLPSWWPAHHLPRLARPDLPALAAAALLVAATIYQPHRRIDRQPGHQYCPQDHRGRSHR